MIPSKLYIPTTTLNFNNIMASESISPAGFYSVRGFGYKRFDKVEPNNLDKRIILYEKYPIFSIIDKEFENYPLVIGIDTKTIGEDIIQEDKNGIYFSEETIYLNPFSTQFIFNNEIEKRSTLSKAEQSLNTKMIAIYQNRIIVKTPNIESFEWQNIDIADSINDFPKHISKDIKINKLKGFLYVYLLGANKSLSVEIVSLKKYAKELENVLSAIITSLDKRATHKQEEEFEKLRLLINEVFYKADEKLQNIIKQKIELYKCDNFIDIFKNEGVLDYWFQKQKIKPQFQIYQFYVSQNNSSDEKQKIFEKYISDLTNAINKIAVPRNMKVEDLPTIQHCSKIEIPQKEFLAKLLNEFLVENWNGEEFINSRLEFATAGGKLFKEELQDNWENSPSQKYINDLRNNLASHTSFSLNDINNQTLKSFAAFCQKGEDDIDKLEDYLISNGIGNFSIAFALWGIVFGFANTPKTLTNNLFLSDDKYVEDVYKYIFKQIHNIDLEGKLESKREKPIEIQSISEPQLPISQSYEKETPISANISSDSEKTNFKKNLKGQKIKQEDQILEIWEKNHFSVNDKLFSDILKLHGIGEATLDKIKTCFNFNLKQAVKRQSTNSMFGTVSSGIFLNDFDFLSNSNDFLAIVSYHEDWKKDLKWFIESHSKSHKDFEKYWKDKPTDNESVIKQFIFLKGEKYKETEALLKSLYL